MKKQSFTRVPNQSDQAKYAYLFTIKRNVINLCKGYLNLLEELRVDHDLFLKKLTDKDKEKLDYLSEDKYNYIRKRILDLGNDSFRDLENFSDMLDIKFVEKKGEGNDGENKK